VGINDAVRAKGSISGIEVVTKQKGCTGDEGEGPRHGRRILTRPYSAVKTKDGPEKVD